MKAKSIHCTGYTVTIDKHSPVKVDKWITLSSWNNELLSQLFSFILPVTFTVFRDSNSWMCWVHYFLFFFFFSLFFLFCSCGSHASSILSSYLVLIKLTRIINSHCDKNYSDWIFSLLPSFTLCNHFSIVWFALITFDDASHCFIVSSWLPVEER